VMCVTNVLSVSNSVKLTVKTNHHIAFHRFYICF
jgi:hypothetical protein